MSKLQRAKVVPQVTEGSINLLGSLWACEYTQNLNYCMMQMMQRLFRELETRLKDTCQGQQQHMQRGWAEGISDMQRWHENDTLIRGEVALIMNKLSHFEHFLEQTMDRFVHESYRDLARYDVAVTRQITSYEFVQAYVLTMSTMGPFATYEAYHALTYTDMSLVCAHVLYSALRSCLKIVELTLNPPYALSSDDHSAMGNETATYNVHTQAQSDQSMRESNHDRDDEIHTNDGVQCRPHEYTGHAHTTLDSGLRGEAPEAPEAPDAPKMHASADDHAYHKLHHTRASRAPSRDNDVGTHGLAIERDHDVKASVLEDTPSSPRPCEIKHVFLGDDTSNDVAPPAPHRRDHADDNREGHSQNIDITMMNGNAPESSSRNEHASDHSETIRSRSSASSSPHPMRISIPQTQSSVGQVFVDIHPHDSISNSGV